MHDCTDSDCLFNNGILLCEASYTVSFALETEEITFVQVIEREIKRLFLLGFRCESKEEF